MNNLYPEAKIIPAMKIWKLEGNNEKKLSTVCTNGEYFAELKKDGYWYEFEKTQNYSYLFSRNVSVKTGTLTEKLDNVPHIREALSILPAGTIVIGEIYYPNKTSKDVTKIMGCLAPEAIKRQEKSGLIHFYLHDIIFCNGIDLQSTGAWKRYQILEAIFKKYNLAQYDFLELAEIVTDNIQEFAVNALNNGEEGAVLKKRTGIYVPNGRPAWATIKIKKIDYLDAICIGFCDATIPYDGDSIKTWSYWINPDDGSRYPIGSYYEQYTREEECMFYAPVTKGHYYGWKTSMKVGAYNDELKIKEIGTIASGLTDELRAAFATNPEEYLNRVVLIQCMEMDKKEQTIRHGFFKMFRDDKPAFDCTLQNIF